MLCSTYVKWFPAVLHDKRLGCAIGLLFGCAKCKMWNAKCKVRNGLLQYCVRRGWLRISGGLILPNAKCKMLNVTSKLQNSKYKMVYCTIAWEEVGWESQAAPSCPMQNAKCKMWHAKCKIQSTKCILREKRFGENLWLRHLAQLTFHLHSSCLSCSCTTVSLMLDVQASFFATSVENPSNQKRI